MTTSNNTRTTSVAFELKDVTFNFPRLGKAHAPRFADGVDGPQFSVQVQDLHADDIAVFKELGINLQETDEGPALNVKAYVTNARGEANEFNVFDADFNEMSQEDRETIGYGSKGHVLGYIYKNSYGTASIRMTDVVITEKVERVPATRADDIKKRLGL